MGIRTPFWGKSLIKNLSDVAVKALDSASKAVLTEEEVAGHEDLAIAFLVLVQDMYDNRTLHPDTKYANSANRVVTSILDLHRRNLV